MPNIRQQEKRVRQASRQRVENLRWRSTAKTLMRRLREAAEKAFAQAANFSAEELGYAIVRLAALDAASKGGSRLPVDLELERALIDVTRPRERAA